ncbi:hypothetical protein EBF04_26925 [Streptomyces sp. I6]|nr:hypothetical protein EBF04_26925 [Streptomyces sp. I6]
MSDWWTARSDRGRLLVPDGRPAPEPQPNPQPQPQTGAADGPGMDIRAGLSAPETPRRTRCPGLDAPGPGAAGDHSAVLRRTGPW